MKKIIKEALLILVLLAIIVSTAIPIIIQWGGLWNTQAALDAQEAVRISDNVLYSDKMGIPDEYRDKMISMFKE